MGWTGNSSANWEMGWEMGYFKTIPGKGWEMGRVKMGEQWYAVNLTSDTILYDWYCIADPTVNGLS